MDLISVLGPYGKRFLTATPTPSAQPKPRLVPNSSKLNTVRRVPRASLKSALKESERDKYHKKKNLAFTRDQQGRLQDRLVEAEKRQKDKRAERVMENRIPSAGYPNIPATPRTRSKAAMEVTTKSASPDEKEKPMSDARKEQLARWKREKEELNRQKMAIKKPPFKAGTGLPVQGQGKPVPITAAAPVPRPGSAGAGSRPGSAGTGSRPVSATAGPYLSRPLPPVSARPLTSRTGISSGTQPQAPLTERRVTRAMAAKSTSVNTSKTAIITNTVNFATTNRSKNTLIAKSIPRDAVAAAVSSVCLTENKAHFQKKKVPSASPMEGILHVLKDAPINTEQPFTKVEVECITVDEVGPKPKEKRLPLKDHVDSNTTNANVPIQTPPLEAPTAAAAPAPAKSKKKKGMQFDAVYMEFNAVFIETCSKLMEYSKKWTAILAEVPDIPEEIVEDIQSTLGQAQLLMESKLPQYGELLYFYLSRHQDPGPVLPCDLQGWWDVATISIEKVKQRFENLLLLSNNNWVKEAPKPTAVKRPRPDQQSTAAPAANPDGPKEKPKASAGLRAFLAGKRNKNKMDVEDQPVVPAAAAPVATPVTPSASVNKKESPKAIQFEGGFFTIDTPVRTPTTASSASLFRVTGSHALHSDPRIGRRQSSSNTSLRMLAVRSSMGPICKIGVVVPENGESANSQSQSFL